MTKLPDSVKIGWKDVKIEQVKTSFLKNNSDYWGQYVARESKIEIQEAVLSKTAMKKSKSLIP